MTVLVGIYSEDRSDVALIADRRMSPTDQGMALGSVASDDAVKTEALSNECAIGFSGNALAQQLILNWLRGIDLGGETWSVERLKHELDHLLPANAASIPLMETVAIVIAGRFKRIPALAWCAAKTGWKAQLVRIGAVYLSPIPETDVCAQDEMESRLYGISDCYLDRVKSAVRFCAERYDSVNDRYILRRLSKDFTKEEGRA